MADGAVVNFKWLCEDTYLKYWEKDKEGDTNEY